MSMSTQPFPLTPRSTISTGRPFLFVLLVLAIVLFFREYALILISIDTLSESETISKSSLSSSSSSSSTSSSLSTSAPTSASTSASTSTSTIQSTIQSTRTSASTFSDSDSDFVSILPEHKNKNESDEYEYKNTNTNKNKYYKHDFSYNHERWENSNNGNGPRIVVLCGPHKTASSTMQTFLATIAGQTISVVNNNDNNNNNDIISASASASASASGDDNKNGNGNSDLKTKTLNNILTPHPTVTKWVWPVGIEEEYVHRMKLMPKATKFYATLASFVTGRRFGFFFNTIEEEDKEESKVWVAEYFRSLFRHPFEEGKNIVIGAEAFDTLVQHRTLIQIQHRGNANANASAGEETHVAPGASEMIDVMTNLFPWNITTETVPSLRMEDIEVEINYRTPRIDHVASIWHQLEKRKDLKGFLISKNYLYMMNSLALALQFVRKGIKTTILDMAGVDEHKYKYKSKEEDEDETNQDANNNNNNNITVVGGLNGVVACDILRMGKNKNQDDGGGLWCDSNSKLYMAGKKMELKDMNKSRNKKKTELGLSEKQMQAINRAIEEYDCGVWQHLQKYQEQGLLRILYPSEHRFSTCNNLERSRDISFPTLVETVRGIAKSND